jgi:hypothetical protein
VCIIANGSSTVKSPLGKTPLEYPLTVHHPELLTYPLDEIPVPVITMNQSWKLVEPTYHVVAEQAHYKWDPEIYDRLHNEKKLFTVGGAWGSGEFPCPGYNLQIRGVRQNLPPDEFTAAIWPEDITQQGVVICFGTSGTVAYSSLQIAIYLGFTEITWVGLDLFGQKFTGQDSGKLLHQREQFRACAPILQSRGIKTRVVGLKSMADCWDRIDWPY